MKKITLLAFFISLFGALNVKAAPNYGQCDNNTGQANPHCLPIYLNGVLAGYSSQPAVLGSDLDAAIKGLEQGIAVSAAMANIPKLDRDKIFSIGVGFGGIDGQSATAVGAAARISEHFVINGNVGHGLGSNNANINTTTWGAGGALSW